MGRLDGQVAVITGGALGTHEWLRKAQGSRLRREAPRRRGLGDELVARGLRAAAWRLDASRETEFESVLDRVAARFGQINILVNNAGVAGGAEVVIDGGYMAR